MFGIPCSMTRISADIGVAWNGIRWELFVGKSILPTAYLPRLPRAPRVDVVRPTATYVWPCSSRSTVMMTVKLVASQRYVSNGDGELRARPNRQTSVTQPVPSPPPSPSPSPSPSPAFHKTYPERQRGRNTDIASRSEFSALSTGKISALVEQNFNATVVSHKGEATDSEISFRASLSVDTHGACQRLDLGPGSRCHLGPGVLQGTERRTYRG